MSKTYFTPGPAQLYPTFAQHVHAALSENIGSLSHRSKAFEAIYAEAVYNLRALLNIPDNFMVFFHSSATEIWERLAQNCSMNTSFHFVNGAFSQRYLDYAKAVGISTEACMAEWGEGFDWEQTQIGSHVDLINFTHNETSTGVMTPYEAMYHFRDSHPDALITVDMVSSVPYASLDFTQIDAAYFSVQKGIGLPAGLGVLILNHRCLERAKAKAASGQNIGSYHSFLSQYKKVVKNQTPETPNVWNIYLLAKVLGDMLNRGIENIRKDMFDRIQRLYAFLDAHPDFELFVKDEAWRSHTVALANVKGDSFELIRRMEAKGLLLGNGYGKMKGKQIRIANFPAIPTEKLDELMHELR